MNKNTILENINKLENNAMFVMSLTSKELFHSNFWAWMIRKYPEIFTNVFYPKIYGTIKVFREKHNFDLLLKISDEVIVIENKFKSMPNQKQLDQYYEKLNQYYEKSKKKIVLVSYFKPMFDLEEYISYETLFNRINQNFLNTDLSVFDKNDYLLIQNYIDFLKLLNTFKNCIQIQSSDKIEKLWAVIKDRDIQEELSKINFSKTFERIFIAKLTEIVLENFKYKKSITEVNINCGRDLNIYSDINFYFPGAWDKNENKRKDLCYLGVSLWGDKYRYYAGLHKAQCGINSPKDGRNDKENKEKGYEYLRKNYTKLFGQQDAGYIWSGYSYEKEMYLYKKIDISKFTVKELTQKVQKDLEIVYNYLPKE